MVERNFSLPAACCPKADFRRCDLGGGWVCPTELRAIRLHAARRLIFADAAWGRLGVADRTAAIRPHAARRPFCAGAAWGRLGVAD